MSQTCRVSKTFATAVRELDDQALQLLYGRWDPLVPGQVADLLAASSIRWCIAGGRAARVGAAARHHGDTDVMVRVGDLAELRSVLHGWHLWEATSGSLRPLLPGVPLSDGCTGLWARRNASEPWQLDLLLDHGGDEWIFKRDSRIRLPWPQAVHSVSGVPYLRPEIALLHKAHLDRPKDRADLAAARLDPDGRAWLAQSLDMTGQQEWAQLVRHAGNHAGL
jgi:hypothetical protein